MMPPVNEIVNEAMLALSSSPAASMVTKATVILVLSLTGAGLARRSRAAVRHALLAGTFAMLLALPVASLVAPPVRIIVPAGAPKPVSLPRATGLIPRVTAHPRTGNPPATPPSPGLSTSALMLIGWACGAALFLLPVAMGLWQVRWLRRSAVAWPQGQAIVEKLALEAGTSRRIEALLQADLAGPMTCGVMHPAIVLPADAQTWEEADLHRAIVHELEHVRRGDWVSHCLARTVCAVYWFHPLVWIAWRKLALEAERCCDDAVLGRSEATAYADQLVGLARRLSGSSKSPLLAMASRAELGKRVGAVLDSRQRRGRAGRLAVALTCAASALLVLGIAPLEMVAAPQPQGIQVNASTPHFSTNTMLVIADVKVSDQYDKTIEGLSANDFVLTEDGVPQLISICEFQKLAATQGQESVSSYYILGYYTPNDRLDGALRKIKITRVDAMAKLDYRSGYYPNRIPSGPAAMQAFGDFIRSGASPAVNHSSDPGVAFPILLRKFQPAYSDEARKAKYQGTVNLSIEIDASGQVTGIKVIRSLGLGLDEKAIKAVKKWKFKAGTKDARAVDMEAQVSVNFRLM